MSLSDGLSVRAVCAAARLGPLDLAALRALRRATQLFSVLLGLRLGQLRESLASPVRAEARILELTFQLDLVGGRRFLGLPDHRRFPGMKPASSAAEPRTSPSVPT